MNKRLDRVLTQLKSLPDEEQEAAADFLLDYLEARLTRKQIAEIEHRLTNPLPYAADEEVRSVFDRLTK